MPKFTKAEKRDLNRFFGLPRRLGRVTTARLAREQDFNSVIDFIDFWRVLLSDARQQEREQLREQLREPRRIRRNERQRIRRAERRTVRNVVNEIFQRVIDFVENALTIEEMAERVREMRQGQIREGFRLYMRSYMNRNISREYNFKNMYHFNNWIKQITENEGIYKDSTGEYIVNYHFKNVFLYVTFEIEEVEGGAVKNSNALKSVRKFKGEYQIFTVRQVPSQHNNCGLECLKYLHDIKDTYLQMRKVLNVKSGVMLTPEHLKTLYKYYKIEKDLRIYDVDSMDIVDAKNDNILYHKNHYYAILSSETINYETKDKIKRGVIFWDIETRYTEDYCLIGETKSFYIKDTILNAHVKRYRSDEYERFQFKTQKGGLSACRQFLDWLKSEGRQHRYYYIYAHNGGNFDVYFLLMNFDESEKGKYIPTLRNTTIIKLDYGNNVFLDTYCFLPYSLHKLTLNYKVETKKMKSFNVNGKQLTNEQMCFYKPKLTFDEFLELEDKDPNFWRLYCDYCYTDCVSLQQVWDKFSGSIDKLLNVYIEKAPHRKKDILTKCQLRQSCTIGGHAQKILNALNGVKSKQSFDFINFSKFTDTAEKHDFLMNNFKRGGISHCHQKGKHTEGVMSVDICSQYPASMIKMKIPSGKSEFVTEFKEGKYGFYLLSNLKFDCPYRFKPVCEVLNTGVLNWSTGQHIETVALDTYMIDYLKKYYGLVSFDVVRGLVSSHEIDGESLFGHYVMPLFEEKAQQDTYKDSNDERYNNSLRETVKLYLNSITGKLVMDRSKYSSLQPTTEVSENMKSINGANFSCETKGDNLNEWISAGVMVYSYSKRLLFEYIRNLPNNSDDVIHVETDSIYFPIHCENEFNKNIDNYHGLYPVKFGKDLGNIKPEKRDNNPCYFLNKKVYTIGGNFIWKGIPQKTLAEDGTEVKILSLDMYDKVFNHKIGDAPIEADFMTMKRTLFGQTKITGHRQKRAMNSSYDYVTYCTEENYKDFMKF